jgi:hypothetical protein
MQGAECISTQAFVDAAREWNAQRVRFYWTYVLLNYVNFATEYGQRGEGNRL